MWILSPSQWLFNVFNTMWMCVINKREKIVPLERLLEVRQSSTTRKMVRSAKFFLPAISYALSDGAPDWWLFPRFLVLLISKLPNSFRIVSYVGFLYLREKKIVTEPYSFVLTYFTPPKSPISNCTMIHISNLMWIWRLLRCPSGAWQSNPVKGWPKAQMLQQRNSSVAVL